MRDSQFAGAANYSPAKCKKHAEKLLLDRHNVPDPAFTIAMRRVGRIVEQGVDRLAAIGPLHLAAIAPDRGPVSQRLGIGRRQDRRMRAVATFIAEGTARAVHIISVKPLGAGEAHKDIALVTHL